MYWNFCNFEATWSKTFYFICSSSSLFTFHLHLNSAGDTTDSPLSIRPPSFDKIEGKETLHIFALISASNAFSLSKSVFCCGQPIDIPSSAFGLGIYAGTVSTFPPLKKTRMGSEIRERDLPCGNGHGLPPGAQSGHCFAGCCSFLRLLLLRGVLELAIPRMLFSASFPNWDLM